MAVASNYCVKALDGLYTKLSPRRQKQKQTQQEERLLPAALLQLRSMTDEDLHSALADVCRNQRTVVVDYALLSDEERLLRDELQRRQQAQRKGQAAPPAAPGQATAPAAPGSSNDG